METQLYTRDYGNKVTLKTRDKVFLMSYEDFRIMAMDVMYAVELTARKRFNRETFKEETWRRTKSNDNDSNFMGAFGSVGSVGTLTMKEVRLVFWIRLPKHTNSNVPKESLSEENS